jgi:hypothetical protein
VFSPRFTEQESAAREVLRRHCAGGARAVVRPRFTPDPVWSGRSEAASKCCLLLISDQGTSL